MYELSRNRYKEMKHFCLQYPEMKERLQNLTEKFKMRGIDPTGEQAAEITDLQHAVKLIETTAFDIGKFPGEEILKTVTEDLPRGEVCEFYIRKFYWLLSERKGV